MMLIGLLACQQVEIEKQLRVEQLKRDMVDLAQMTDLSIGQNEILLSDYFQNPEQIDSIKSNESLLFDWKIKEGVLSFNPDKSKKVLLQFHFWIDDLSYTLLFRKSRKVVHTLSFNPGNNNYTDVAVAGSMNDWDASKTKLNFDGLNWTTSLILNPGKYHYLFEVDGERILDPDNDIKEDNNIGGFNSVLNVEVPGKGKKPVLSTKVIGDKGIEVNIRNELSEFIVLWQNRKLGSKKLSFENGTLMISIPKMAAKFERSYLRVYAYNKNGIGNDLLIPLSKGKVLKSTSQLNRNDKHAGILYFLMVDRFKNGTTTNDKKVDDNEIAERANYHGGDIEGIMQKLQDGYFNKMGINTIWLSPIVQNTWNGFTEYPEPHRKFSGYHGYWPIHLSNVDRRFGTEQELKQLVSLAHEKNINIMLDVVSNHVHRECHLFQNHPEWFTNVDLPDGSKNIRLWDAQRLTTWFDTFLPSVDFTNDEVLDLVSDSAMFWLTDIGVDGFRHDATKHIPEKYWRTLTSKVKDFRLASGKSVYQVGETFGGRELIGSYVAGGMLDGQFDFNLYWDARSVFAMQSESFVKLAKSAEETFEYYGAHHLMGNITGNHDMPRFISYASGALAFDEDSQEAGWQRQIQVEDPLAYKRLQCLTAFTMTIPGVPVVYYGDEFGMPGAGDPDNRRPMRFDDLNDDELETKEIAEKLVHLRRKHLALIYGEFSQIMVDDEVFVYMRKYFDEVVVVIFNKSMEERNIEFDFVPDGDSRPDAQFGSEFRVLDKSINLTLDAWSFEILTY